MGRARDSGQRWIVISEEAAGDSGGLVGGRAECDATAPRAARQHPPRITLHHPPPNLDV